MAEKILIVEDEAKIARFIELELAHEGYETDKAEDGRKGLELAESGVYDAVMDKVSGLDMGADDYVTKPFAIEELLARIRLALRRRGSTKAAGETLVCGDLSLSVPRHEVKMCGEEIDLTSREFSLLQTLLENKNVVLSRDSLLEKVWGYDYMGETNVVDVYVRYLRSKIDNVYGQNVIQTVRGVGYVIRDEHE